MGKKQKNVKENQTNKEIKHVNERHQNGLYSDAKLTKEDIESELYKNYIKVTTIPKCMRFLRDKKKENNLPDWAEDELQKLTQIIKETDRRKYLNNQAAILKKTANYREKNRSTINKNAKKYRAEHPEKIQKYNQKYRNENQEKIKKYRDENKEKIQKYRDEHKEERNEKERKRYNHIVENIEKIRAGKIDELSDNQLLSVQNYMRRVHKVKFRYNVHGLNLGDKGDNTIYDPNNLPAFKAFLKSQVGVDAVSQIDFNELNNMPFDFNVLGDEEKFDNSYFNNDIIPNENHQQDNNYQPINEQEEQPIDKYGFLTYGHKTNGTNDKKLFALNHAHELDEQSI